MMRQQHQHDIACCIFVALLTLRFASGDPQDFLNVQHRVVHLPDAKFGINEYSEYSDTEDREKGSLSSRWNQPAYLNYNGRTSKVAGGGKSYPGDVLDQNIKWDSSWVVPIKFVQVSAVSIDPNGHVAIFHRGSRIWGMSTFDKENRFNPYNGKIKENTIILMDKSGKKLATWGSNMFYLPHGLTVDMYGNYWITDVALHQVFKFDAKDVERHIEELKKQEYKQETARNRLVKEEFPSIVLEPTIVLGKAFEPGNDKQRFCKPTAVAVQKNGEFFVSDGYCNSRIIKFNAKGERILEWGRRWGEEEGKYLHYPPPNAFFVPHALAIAHETNIIYVADRENGRVVAFHTNNGTFYREFRHHSIGTKVYSVAYAQGKLYLVNGPDIPRNETVHVHGFILDATTGELLSQFGPGHDMDRPHDIAVTENGSEIYVAELDLHTVYKFVQDVNSSTQTINSVTHINPQHEPGPLTDNDENASSGGTATATLVLSLVTAAVIFIALCVAIAAVVARCQKRGCLLTMRTRMRWEPEKRENFKLSSLLEGRRGRGFKFLERRPNPRDFSKLNTEPETSEDEHPANALARVI